MAAHAGTATPATVGRPGAMVAMYGVLSDAFAGGGTTPVRALQQERNEPARGALTRPRLSTCAVDGAQAARSLEVHLLRLKPVFLRLLDKPPRDAAVRAQLAPNRPVTIEGQPLTLSQGFLEHALKLSDQVRRVGGGAGLGIPDGADRAMLLPGPCRSRTASWVSTSTWRSSCCGRASCSRPRKHAGAVAMAAAAAMELRH